LSGFKWIKNTVEARLLKGKCIGRTFTFRSIEPSHLIEISNWCKVCNQK